MKKRGYMARWLTALPLAVLLLLAGCTKEESAGMEISGTVPVPMPDGISLTLNLSLGTDRHGTRATGSDNGDEPLRPGMDDPNARENRINTIYLFFEDLNDDGTPVGGKPKIWFRFVHPYTPGGGPVTLEIPQGETDQKLTTGLKQVYVGANLTDEQAACFADGNKAYSLSDDYVTRYGYGLTEDYAPGRGIGLVESPLNEYTRKHIAMFCVEDEGQRLFLEEGKRDYTCRNPFTLKRNVAKVLVTCEVGYDGNGTDGTSGIGYCRLTGDLSDGQKPRGWIRQNDVRFLVNALNRHAYIMQKSSWNTDRQKWEYPDPNYENLHDYFTVGPNGVPLPTEKANREFYYNAVQTLNSQSAYYVGTLRHDNNKIPVIGSDNTGCYYEGLYCPENTFDAENVSEADHLILSNYGYPWPMITHVAVTVKFTPKDLYVDKAIIGYIDEVAPELDEAMRNKIKELVNNSTGETLLNGQIVRIESPSEEVSWIILTASLKKGYKVQDGNIYDEKKEGLPEKTYCSIVTDEGDTEFYTYGAALAIAKEAGWGTTDTNKDPKKLGSFKIMPRGRGYYYTYIDNCQAHEKDTPTTYADSQIERNVYYILTIKAFSTPGRTGSEPSYIKVHTRVADWKDGGTADVELN